jgi:hypothetical protein
MVPQKISSQNGELGISQKKGPSEGLAAEGDGKLLFSPTGDGPAIRTAQGGATGCPSGPVRKNGKNCTRVHKETPFREFITQMKKLTGKHGVDLPPAT